MKGLKILTFSRAATHNLCRKKEYYKYGLGVRRESGEALRMGSAFHEGLDQLKRSIDFVDVLQWIYGNYLPLIASASTPEHAEAFVVEQGKVVELLRGYIFRWGDGRSVGLEIVASELTFDFTIKKPGNAHPLISMRYAGKIDGICKVK